MSNLELPSAEYRSQDTTTKFTLESVQKENLSSEGATTGPSPYLLESTGGQYVDKDKPAPLNLNTDMGVLRGYVTKLQDDINVFLTERIKSSGSVTDINEEEQNTGSDDDK